jgi:hypothetical protein
LASTDDRDLISTHVVRVEVQADQLAVELKAPKQGQPRGRENETAQVRDTSQLEADARFFSFPGKNRRRNGGAKSSCRNPWCRRTFALFVPKPAPSPSRPSPVVGAGSMKLLPAP